MTPPSAPTLRDGVARFLADDPGRLLIGGSWQAAASGTTFDTFDPATGQVLASVARGEAADAPRRQQVEEPVRIDGLLRSQHARPRVGFAREEMQR